MNYRVLSREEITCLGQLDRTERIDHVYHMRDGALVLEKEHWDVPRWSSEEVRRRVTTLQQEYDRGATFYGAFNGPRLAGVSVLDHVPLRTGIDRLNLSGLWVSHRHRGRGVGTALVRLVEREARDRGARALYVSATPSGNTVRFYRSLGFHVAEFIDPDQFESEPEDIHMELALQ